MKQRVISIALVACFCAALLLIGCGNLMHSEYITGGTSGNSSSAPSENPSGNLSSTPSTNPSDAPSGDASDVPSGDVSDTPSDIGKISLNREDFTLLAEGEKWKLYNGDVPAAEVTFTSDDETICTFVNGVVTAVGTGKTKVYAEYNGVKLSCKVFCRWTTSSGSASR